jgi:methyltransferase (TIGR00027 family)
VDTQRASRTAVIVCQARAAADGRFATDRFADPVAIALLHSDEQVVVRQVRTGVPPKTWADRVEFETVRAAADVIVPRTVTIDDAVRARAASQLVILGAGLDDRAWRMPELAGVDVFEVDHPASQADKRDRVGDLRPLARSVRYVPVDFSRDQLAPGLASAGHQTQIATTWIWEGVVTYLRRHEVAATLRAIRERSTDGSRLIVNYQTMTLSTFLGRMIARAMAATARRRSPWTDEPVRSSWTAGTMSNLLATQGFRVSRDENMLAVASDLTMPVRQRQSLRSGRVAIADL